MRNLLLSLLLLFSVQTAFPVEGWRKGEKEIKVFIRDAEDARKLHKLALNGDFYRTYALIYAVDEELRLIENSGLDYEITINNLNKHFKSFWTNRDDYHSYQEIIDLMDSLVMAFPDICSKKNYGTSVGGRQLAALKISDNVTVDEPEAEVFFDAGIHGDEIGGPENLIRFARDLCYAYNDDPYISDLIDNREIWLYIMVNPDGRENMSRYNENGTDLNRDWGYMWNAEGNSLSAFSQIESKALRDCIYEHQFVIHTSYHSGTEFISYPWSYRPQHAPDYDHIDFLAELYSTSSGYSNISYGQGNTGMYAINGSTKDYNYGAMGSVSWSMEISYAKQPPASQIMEYYNYNKPAMLTMIEYAGYGINGIITDAQTGEAVAANVFINDGMPVFSNKNTGDYHKYVIAGTYSIKVVANGYQTKLVTGVSVPDNNSQIAKNIALQPDPSHNAARIVSCRIPFNNQGDEAKVTAAIGPPDNINYSIGKNGWVIYDVTDPVRAAEGPDIIIHEGDDSPEGYSLYAANSKEGPWYNLGSASGTAEFELSGVPFGQAKYIKIEDDGDGVSQGDNVGFDLDAIEVVNAPDLEYIAFSSVDTSGGNGDYQINPGETALIAVDIRNKGINPARFAHCQLSCESQLITINEADTTIQKIAQNDTASAIFEITADYSLQPGTQPEFKMYLSSNNGHYTDTISFSFTVGVYVDVVLPLAENKISIYPLPFNNHLDVNLKLDKAASIDILIFDLSGKPLIRQKENHLSAGDNHIRINNIDNKISSPGIYFIHIQSKDIQLTRKIIRTL